MRTMRAAVFQQKGKLAIRDDAFSHQRAGVFTLAIRP